MSLSRSLASLVPLAPLACLAAVAVAACASPALATDDPAVQLGGVYVGTTMDKKREPVTIELRGNSLVVLDPEGVAIVAIDAWELAGPGGKAGDVHYKARAFAKVASTREGKVRGTPKSSMLSLRLREWPGQKLAVLCATRPGDKATIERVPTHGSSEAVPETLTCWDLTRVYAPAVEAAPVPDKPKVEPDFECMRECRQQNMMKAVGAEVIEEDCRRACTKP